MKNGSEYTNLNNELSLRESSDLILIVRTVALNVIWQNDKLTECHLTFYVTPELYQLIDKQALFNLKHEIRSPLFAGALQPSIDIQVKASLNPDLLPLLTEPAQNVYNLANYLLKLNQEQPENPLFSTYSWYGLEVKQKSETGETGYQTLWMYLQPSAIFQDGVSIDRIAQAMMDFSQNWIQGLSPNLLTEEITQSLEQITDVFAGVSESLAEMTQQILSESMEKVNTTLENLTQEITNSIEEIPANDTLFTIVVAFFQQEKWHFYQVEAESVISMNFLGNNGLLHCYTKIREAEEQFVFYSSCSITCPESQRPAMAEFIARANYNMIIGNFELDWDGGEVRYKTSIDIEGQGLSYTCLKNLVYTNVSIMDKYLPGITSVMNGDTTPKSAIEQVELVTH